MPRTFQIRESNQTLEKNIVLVVVVVDVEGQGGIMP